MAAGTTNARRAARQALEAYSAGEADFSDYYLGAINRLVAQSPDRPLLTNTWGDALYSVFASVQDGGVWCRLSAEGRNGGEGVPAPRGTRP